MMQKNRRTRVGSAVRTQLSVRAIATLLLTTMTLCGCKREAEHVAVHEEPAHVDHHVEEGDLNTVKLTQRAADRLGIVLAETELREVRSRRTVGGEVTLPPGQTVVVTAPLAGTVLSPPDTPVPTPGERIDRNQTVFQFEPLLTAERDVLTPAERIRVAETKANVATLQIEAARQIESAKVSVNAAQIVYDRAVQLLAKKAGSQRAVDEAEAALKLAREALTTAEARDRFLSGIELDDEQPGKLEQRPITSPVAGILHGMDSAPGETVSVGDTLFTVLKTDRVWIRVPIYVGQWRDVDTTESASVSEFGANLQSESRVAHYVSAPPTANPDATTVDLYYELQNPQGTLYPGQKLAVTVPLRSRAKSIVVPFNAVLYDIHGGEWVYEQQEPLVFARRRVSVYYVDGPNAILATGPEPGRQVVTDGAAELFGTEFGVGH